MGISGFEQEDKEIFYEGTTYEGSPEPPDVFRLLQRLFGSPLWPNAVLPRPVPFRVRLADGCTCCLCDTSTSRPL